MAWNNEVQLDPNTDTIAFGNDIPWRNLAGDVSECATVDDIIRAAKLDWTVSKRKLFRQSSEGKLEELGNQMALTRDSDDKFFDIVGKGWNPTQNRDAFEFFGEFMEAGDAKMVTAGSLDGGRWVWGLADLREKFTVNSSVSEDVINGYLFMAAPHRNGKALIAKMTAIRARCNNLFSLMVRKDAKHSSSEFRMSHVHKFDKAMRQMAINAIGAAHAQVDEFKKNANILAAKKMTRGEAMEVLASIYQPDASVEKLRADFANEASPRLKTLMDVLERAPGAEPETAWGVFNAVTYYSDHLASRSEDKRVTNAWIGRSANQKVKALEILLGA